MKNLFFIFFSLIISFVPLAIYANGLVPCSLTGKDACQLCDIFVLLDNIFDFFLLTIVPILTILMVVIAAFYFIFSQGDPQNFKRAKNIFLIIVYSLLIIYGAWIFVSLFFQAIGVSEWTNLSEGWWKINCPH